MSNSKQQNKPNAIDLEAIWQDPIREVLNPTSVVVPSTYLAHEEQEQQPPQQPPPPQQQHQQQQQQQPIRLGFDGHITALVKVQILVLLEHLVNVVMDFTAENLSRSGVIVTAFLLFWGLLL